MAVEKKSLREKYIDQIMATKYASDDPKYDGRNRAFLEGLTLNELANLADEKFEDEFELDGEVKDFDFDPSEL